MSWQAQGCQSPGRCCLPEQTEGHGGVMGDAGFPARSLVPYPKPRKCPLSGGTSFSSFLLGAPLPTTDVWGTAAPTGSQQPPQKFIQEAWMMP